MKLTNGEIFEAKPALGKLIEKELPVKVSYELAKMGNKLNEQYNIIESVRNGLIHKYGEEDNGSLRVKEGTKKFAKFVDEFNELMKQEVELDVNTVEIPQEVEGKKVQIEPKVLMPLIKLVEIK